MTRKLIALACSSLLVAACGGATPATPGTQHDAAKAPKKTTAPAVAEAETKLAMDVDFEEPKSATPLAKRDVGDFFVHRFSGSFREAPITLSEEVVAKAGNLIVIDYLLDDGGKQSALRVTHDIESYRVLRVREMKGEKELPSSEQAFEAMMSKVTFAPDSNERMVSREKTTCLVGGEELNCEKIVYDVTVGDKSAKFTVTNSPDIEDGDLSGEITGADGKILYRAELIDMGKAGGTGVASRE